MLAVVGGAALAVAAMAGSRMARAAEGLDVELAFEFKALKIAGATSPLYLQGQGDKILFSDGSGALYSAALTGGKATLIAKVKDPGGLAIAPAGFGSYAGEIFVLSQANENSPCEVMRIDNGAALSFAKLPNAGSLNGGKATECRDLEFGAAGTPFAGKLYAVTNGNATIYEIDSSAKARAFATYDQPPTFELSSISFTPADDPKAPNSMLVGARPRMEMAAKVGRINVLGPDGKEKPEYRVGFVLPTGWAYAPAAFGNYGGQLLILDRGRPAAKNAGARDGQLYRVDDKDVTLPFASGLVDPNCLRIIGHTIVIADPAEQGKPGKGAIVVLTSML